MPDSTDEFDYIKLQGEYGGQWVALRGATVAYIGATYDELCDLIEAADPTYEGLAILFVESPTAVSVYRISPSL